MRNLHQLFDWQYIGQIIGGDFALQCTVAFSEYMTFNEQSKSEREKCGLISEDISNLVPSSKKKFERLSMVILIRFFKKRTNRKISSEIKPPLS